MSWSRPWHVKTGLQVLNSPSMLHQHIRRARETEKLSQQSLATLAGVPRSQLQLLEKGGNVTLETLEKILTALGLTLIAIPTADIAAARRALRDLDPFLSALAGPAPDDDADELSPELRETIRQLDAMVDLDEKSR